MFGPETGPEVGGDMVEELSSSYGTAPDVFPTAESILTDLQDRINNGEITGDQATAVAESLGL